MSTIFLIDVCKHIIDLQSEINSEIASRGGYNLDTGTLLGDCSDYCMFVVLDRLAARTEDIQHLINELNECESYCNSRGDKLHAGFFFALSQLLALKHEVRMLPGEAITREDFENSWRKTRRELGL